VAIKAVNGERLNQKLSENLATEVTVMKEMRDDHIVELYDFQRTGHYIYLVMEYCGGGDLAGLLRKRKILKEAEARKLVRQLAAALQVLHAANYAHRDLKPQNLLLTQEGTLKLGDFGFARFVDPADMAATLCGSPLYMAPEILRYERYDGKADLWSVGAILYEMLWGRAPFRAQNHIQLIRVIEASPGIPFPSSVLLDEKEFPVEVSECCKELILGLLKKNPDERLSFHQFITHPFLEDEQVERHHNLSVEEQKAPEPQQQQRGFTIPRSARMRSGSAGSLPASRLQQRSSLSTSFKALSFQPTGAMAPTFPLVLGATLSAREDALHSEEESLQSLLKTFQLERPALVKRIQRDAQLGLLLKDLAEANLALLDNRSASTSQQHIQGNRTLFLETLQLALMACKLLQDLLGALKETSLVKPTDYAARGLVLWLYGKTRDLHAVLSSLQRQSEEASAGGSMMAPGMSITSSSTITTSDSPPPASVSDILYNHALHSVSVDILIPFLNFDRPEMGGCRNSWDIPSTPNTSTPGHSSFSRSWQLRAQSDRLLSQSPHPVSMTGASSRDTWRWYSNDLPA